MCFPVSSFFGSPLPLSPFFSSLGVSSEVFICGFISSLSQRVWDKNALLLLLLLLYARFADHSQTPNDNCQFDSVPPENRATNRHRSIQAP
jgi:hypothetical protein